MITITIAGKFANPQQKEAVARAIRNSFSLQGMNVQVGEGFHAEQMSGNRLHGVLRSLKSIQMCMVVEIKE